MLKELANRRCCRSYDSARPVEEEKINEIIKAGLHAPSAINKQDGIIVAITNKEIRDKLMVLNAKDRGGDTFYGAPVVLLVASKGPFTELDGAAMIENMLIEAAAQGLGACWIHRAKDELESKEGQELFASVGVDLSEYTGVGHVILGYPKDPQYRPKEIKEGRVFWVK